MHIKSVLHIFKTFLPLIPSFLLLFISPLLASFSFLLSLGFLGTLPQRLPTLSSSKSEKFYKSFDRLLYTLSPSSFLNFLKKKKSCALWPTFFLKPWQPVSFVWSVYSCPGLLVVSSAVLPLLSRPGKFIPKNSSLCVVLG